MHRLTHTGPIQAFAPCGSPLATPCPTTHTVGHRPALAWRINTASRKPESHWIADSDKPPLPRLWRSTLPSH